MLQVRRVPGSGACADLAAVSNASTFVLSFAVTLASYRCDVVADLQFEKKLGAGAFGIVYLAQFRGESVADKQLISDKVDSDNLTVSFRRSSKPFSARSSLKFLTRPTKTALRRRDRPPLQAPSPKHNPAPRRLLGRPQPRHRPRVRAERRPVRPARSQEVAAPLGDH